MKSKKSDSVRIVKRYVGKRVRGVIYQGDALAFLKKMKHDSAGIVFLDPPFNLGKIYDS